MTINYTTLTAAKTTDYGIKNWVNRSDIPVTDILTEAQAEIYNTLRVREMQFREAITFSSSGDNSNSYDLTGLTYTFLDPIEFKPYTWAYPLRYEHSGNPYRDSSGDLIDSETPQYWWIENTTAYVDVDLTSDLTGIFKYYGLPTYLSGSNETNFLTVRYPTMLRYACMNKAYEHMKQDQAAKDYYQKLQIEIGKVQVGDDLMYRGMEYTNYG